MKKIIAFVITIAMVLSIAAVPAFAINPMTISGSDAGEVLLTAGGQFDVTVTLGNNPGVAGVSVDVTWSKTDLKLVNCALGTVLPNDSTVTGAISTNTGKHVLSLGNMLATENYTANGVIATLTFEILSTATKGEKSIGLAVQNDDEYNILDAAMNPVATTFTAGKVTLVKAKHNVVFNPANGGESTTVAVEDGSTVAKPTDPQKEGSDFVEWQLNNAAYDFSAPVTAAIELTATYKIKTFKVTFVTAHGTAPAEQTVNWNETANKPADPSEENWQFDGWVTTDGGSTAFDFSTPIKADTQVYAAWTKLHVHQPVRQWQRLPPAPSPETTLTIPAPTMIARRYSRMRHAHSLPQ